MKTFKNEKLGLILGLSFSVLGMTQAHAGGPKCDLSIAQRLDVVKVTEEIEGNYSTNVAADKESPTCLNAAQKCIDKITELSAGDSTVASRLRCGSPRRTNFQIYNNKPYSNSCEVDVIQSTPVSVAEAIQMKCEKIAGCIENASNSDDIIKLKQVAQAIQCQ